MAAAAIAATSLFGGRRRLRPVAGLSLPLLLPPSSPSPSSPAPSLPETAPSLPAPAPSLPERAVSARRWRSCCSFSASRRSAASSMSHCGISGTSGRAGRGGAGGRVPATSAVGAPSCHASNTPSTSCTITPASRPVRSNTARASSRACRASRRSRRALRPRTTHRSRQYLLPRRASSSEVLATAAQLDLPCVSTPWRRATSSSGVHASTPQCGTTLVASRFCQRSLHLVYGRPPMCCGHHDAQSLAPCTATSSRSFASSSTVQGPFLRPGLRAKRQRSRQ